MSNKLMYLTGSAVSSFGDGCQQIAMMWLVFHLTGSALSIGVTISIYYLPSLVMTPYLSVLVDQRDSKWLTIATDASRCLLVGFLAAFLFFGWESVSLLYLLQFILAIGYTLYKPASTSFIKSSFNNQDLAQVFARSTSFNEMANIAGLAAAGWIVTAWSPTFCFLLNALTFAVPVILFAFIKRVRQQKQQHSHIQFMQSLKEGVAFVRSTKGMAFLFLLSILNSIAIQMAATIFLPLAKEMNGGSELYSTFEMAFSIGVIVSGLMVTGLMKKMNNKLLLLTISGMLVVSGLMAMSRLPLIMILLIFGFGYFVASHLIATQTLIKIRTPEEMIGRVIGLRTILASVVKISSALTTGFLITKIPISHVFILFSGLMLLSLLSYKKVRAIEFKEWGL